MQPVCVENGIEAIYSTGATSAPITAELSMCASANKARGTFASVIALRIRVLGNLLLYLREFYFPGVARHAYN